MYAYALDDEFISVEITNTSLAPGVYNATVTVTAAGADNSPQLIPITYTVRTQPILQVTPLVLNFASYLDSTLPASKTISVGNGGDGTVTWTATESENWIHLSTTSGTNSGTITVTIDSNGTVGTDTAIITIAAPGSANTPQTVRAIHVVSASPGEAPDDGEVPVGLCCFGSSQAITDSVTCVTNGGTWGLESCPANTNKGKHKGWFRK
jgi:hypothetical protein